MCLVGDMQGVWEADNSLRDKYVSLIKACETAIKALDVKTAYWIRQETPYGYANSYECSECGRVIWNDEGEEGLEDFPYCHCGRRMVKEKEE